MYDPALKTFLTVAACGSFTAAAELVFLTPTAVMKQINALESRLGLRLFDRTPGGVRLTAAGRTVQEGACTLIREAEDLLAAAKAAAQANDTTFCVGTSLLNPAKPFMELWHRTSDAFPGYKLHLVPFEDTSENILTVIDKLGEQFDFLVGVCDSKAWLSRCCMLPLGHYRKMIAVPRGHRLSAKKELTLADLYGETLMMVSRGDSGINDRLRDDLVQNHPQIRIADTPPFYDLSVFNRAVETNRLLLSLECWQEVHPGLVTLPVRWDYSIPYGLLYSKSAPPDVLQLVEAVRACTNTSD